MSLLRIAENDADELRRFLEAYESAYNAVSQEKIPPGFIEERLTALGSARSVTVFSLLDDDKAGVRAGTLLVKFDPFSDDSHSNLPAEVLEAIVAACQEETNYYASSGQPDAEVNVYSHRHSFKTHRDIDVSQMHSATQLTGVHFYSTLEKINERVNASTGGGHKPVATLPWLGKSYAFFVFAIRRVAAAAKL